MPLAVVVYSPILLHNPLLFGRVVFDWCRCRGTHHSTYVWLGSWRICNRSFLSACTFTNSLSDTHFFPIDCPCLVYPPAASIAFLPRYVFCRERFTVTQAGTLIGSIIVGIPSAETCWRKPVQTWQQLLPVTSGLAHLLSGTRLTPLPRCIPTDPSAHSPNVAFELDSHLNKPSP